MSRRSSPLKHAPVGIWIASVVGGLVVGGLVVLLVGMVGGQRQAASQAVMYGLVPGLVSLASARFRPEDLPDRAIRGRDVLLINVGYVLLLAALLVLIIYTESSSARHWISGLLAFTSSSFGATLPPVMYAWRIQHT